MNPDQILHWVVGYWWVLALAIFLAAYKLTFRLFGVVIVPEDSIGVVNRKWVLFGANRSLPDGAIVALRGEAGIQAETLAPGLHFWLWPWQYVVTLQEFITVPTGGIGIVSSRDGARLADGRVLAKRVECALFQAVAAHFAAGDVAGRQRCTVFGSDDADHVVGDFERLLDGNGEQAGVDAVRAGPRTRLPWCHRSWPAATRAMAVRW